MMKKFIIIFFIISAFTIPLLFSAQVPKKDIKIKKTGDKKSSVVFSHMTHENLDLAKDCTSCHDAVKSMKTAHNLCMDCHKKMNIGPVKCNECHI